jgi:hypothetical protein
MVTRKGSPSDLERQSRSIANDDIPSKAMIGKKGDSSPLKKMTY